MVWSSAQRSLLTTLSDCFKACPPRHGYIPLETEVRRCCCVSFMSVMRHLLYLFLCFFFHSCSQFFCSFIFFLFAVLPFLFSLYCFSASPFLPVLSSPVDGLLTQDFYYKLCLILNAIAARFPQHADRVRSCSSSSRTDL